MDSVQNLRDIGGYVNNRDFTTRWGKIYRSGKLNTLSEWDSMRLDNLGIKTSIDLRGANEVHKEPIRYKNLKVINLPIPITDEDSVSKLIEEGRMRKGDAILFLQDMYLQFIKGNSPMFASAMNELLDKENYPVLITCSLGKDRAGFLSALILASLGVPEDTILKDYTTSNDCIEINKIAKLPLHKIIVHPKSGLYFEISQPPTTSSMAIMVTMYIIGVIRPIMRCVFFKLAILCLSFDLKIENPRIGSIMSNTRVSSPRR